MGLEGLETAYMLPGLDAPYPTSLANFTLALMVSGSSKETHWSLSYLGYHSSVK